MSSDSLTLYGWDMSYFTSKMACYLKYKEIPYNMKCMNLMDMYVAKQKFGTMIMPFVKTTNNKYIQDTRNIINYLEKKYPEPSVFPEDPRKYFISCLLEVWGDEFWLPFAMHYRWSFPENNKYFQEEAGQNLLPYFPTVLQNKAAELPENTLRSFLPYVGVIHEQHEILEKWTVCMLHLLNAHLRFNNYLLGDKPTIGDFGLVGPLIPHLARDPYPRANLLTRDTYPYVYGWIDRMMNPSNVFAAPKPKLGVHSDNIIPKTLEPILIHIFNEFIPMIKKSNEQLIELRKNEKFYKNVNGYNTAQRSLPRKLDFIEFPLFEMYSTYKFKRYVMPFNVYKIQNVLNVYKQMTKDRRQQVNKCLDEYPNGKNILELDIPQLERVGVNVRFT